MFRTTKKVAIAGAGLAGLAAAVSLLETSEVSVTLFDPKGIGKGASGVSTGLLHPFPGKWALRSWQGEEAMKTTLAWIDRVEEATGWKVANRSGILRLAMTPWQQTNFQKRIDKDNEWWSPEQVVEWIPGAAAVPALWMSKGITVYSKLYLEGLWRRCQKKGAQLVMEPFSSPEPFDVVVLATGADIKLPQLTVTRGQTLVCRWPKPIRCSLLSQGHLTLTEDPSLCQIGSTYEDPLKPLEDSLGLKEMIGGFYPLALDFEVVETRMGYRTSRNKGYRPVVSKIDPKTWVFSGLGSRGLLYHAWLGEALAKAIVDGSEELLPHDLYKSLSLNQL